MGFVAGPFRIVILAFLPPHLSVQAGIHCLRKRWIPAFAGMTLGEVSRFHHLLSFPFPPIQKILARNPLPAVFFIYMN